MQTAAHLSPNHPEWPRMWESLADQVGDYADCDPETGECWQYMGTYWHERPAIGATLPSRVLVHEFRHRHRPEHARPIQGLADASGRVVLRLATSSEHSGSWNHPIEEGTVMFARARQYA